MCTDGTSRGRWLTCRGCEPGKLFAEQSLMGTVGVARDPHGDASLWTNLNGFGVVSSKVYDPFGGIAGTTANAGGLSSLGYQADYTDPTTGDVNMGARWYNPSTATFRSRDTYAGKLQTPFSLNRYTYGLNNPTRYWDPTGRFSVEQAWSAAMSAGFGFNQVGETIRPVDVVSYDKPANPSAGVYNYVTNFSDGSSTIATIAPTGVAVSTGSNIGDTQRSGNLSFTPTDAVAAAAVDLIDRGLSASSIAQAVNDATVTASATATADAIVANVGFAFESAYADPSGLRSQQASLRGGVPRIAGIGTIKIDLFIATKMAGLGVGACFDGSCVTREPIGNGRGFEASASLSQSKVQMTLDFDSGKVWVGVNETCWKETSNFYGDVSTETACYKARSLSVSSFNVVNGRSSSVGPDNAKNLVSIVTDQVGRGYNVNVTYDLVLAGISDRVAPHIDGQIYMNIQPNVFSMCRDRDAFPSLGIYRFSGGRTQRLIEDNQTLLGPAVGLSGAQSDTGCKVFYP